MVIWYFPGVLQRIRAICRLFWYSSHWYLSNGHTVYGRPPHIRLNDTLATVQESNHAWWILPHVHLTWVEFPV